MIIFLAIHIICYFLLQPTILRNSSRLGKFDISEFIYLEIFMLLNASWSMFMMIGTIIAYKYEEVADKFDNDVFNKKDKEINNTNGKDT